MKCGNDDLSDFLPFWFIISGKSTWTAVVVTSGVLGEAVMTDISPPGRGVMMVAVGVIVVVVVPLSVATAAAAVVVTLIASVGEANRLPMTET